MKRCLIALTCFLFTVSTGFTQPRYLVSFIHKGAATQSLSNPATYLSQRAIDRRIRYKIAIDSSDLPVPATWVSQISSIPNVIVLNVSRWLNMISIQTADLAAISAINALPYVRSTQNIAARAVNYSNKIEEQYSTVRFSGSQGTTELPNYGTPSFNEIKLHEGQFLHSVGLRGQGMQVAVLDGGFFNYTTLRAFDSMNANGQVLGTWDFVARNASVVEDNAHGMQCLSTIAANIPGEFIGKAPKASFFLYRTEDVSSEYPIEEFNWACGAERSDSTGADVISSSLGYGYQFSGGFPDYPYSNLNGDLTLSARAADLAAAKGLLVFIAAGNSGNDYWKKIVTPADADSVLAVGAVSTAGLVASFSSYGPSADGRVKPDIASVGLQALVQSTGNTTISTNGTSFACPNMAGLGTCLWQGFPEMSNMRIVRALREAGSVSTNPDDRIGYGIPDMKKAFTTLLKEYATSKAVKSNCTATLTWQSKDVSAMRYLVERKKGTETAYTIIGIVTPRANTLLTNNSYEWKDDLSGQPVGVLNYRITQVIDTTSAAYTSLTLGTTLIINQESLCSGSDNMIRLAPNPASGTTTIIFSSAESIPQLDITVFDMKGRIVMEATGAKSTGLYRKDLNVASISTGKYLIRITDGRKQLAILDLLKL